MRGLPLSPRHFRAIAGGYGALVVALTVYLFVLDARVSERIGLQREVYPDVGFSGIPRVDVSRGISLDFLREDPALSRRFFSVRWNGFWYLPEAGEFELHRAGDDRLDVWVDGERVIRRGAPAGMHTQSRTLWLEAGVHRLRVDYEQHGEARALSLLWAPRGERPRPLPSHHMFQAWPDRDAIRLANQAAWLERIVPIGWGVPVALGVAFLSRHARFRAILRKLTREAGRQPHNHRADEIAAAPPKPLARSGLLAVHAVFLGLSALFCSRAFLLTDLNSHAILTGDPALMNWQLQWVSRALYTDPLNLFNGNTFHPYPNVVALTDHMTCCRSLSSTRLSRSCPTARGSATTCSSSSPTISPASAATPHREQPESDRPVGQRAHVVGRRRRHNRCCALSASAITRGGCPLRR